MNNTQKYVDCLTHEMFESLWNCINKRLLNDKDLNAYIHDKNCGLSLEEIALLQSGKKIEAIKTLRSRVGCTLKEAIETTNHYKLTAY